MVNKKILTLITIFSLMAFGVCEAYCLNQNKEVSSPSQGEALSHADKAKTNPHSNKIERKEPILDKSQPSEQYVYKILTIPEYQNLTQLSSYEGNA
jgi:hypothetical protein